MTQTTNPPTATPEPQLLTRRQAAALLGLSTVTLGQWAWLRTGPRFIRLGARTVRYRRADLEAYLVDRTVGPRSQPQN